MDAPRTFALMGQVEEVLFMQVLSARAQVVELRCPSASNYVRTMEKARIHGAAIC